LTPEQSAPFFLAAIASRAYGTPFGIHCSMFQWELLLRLKAGMEGATVWALVVLIWPITEISASEENCLPWST
jgi:hypothetical protein